MTANEGVLSVVHELELPAKLREKIAEVRGLVDLEEVQRVVLRIYSEIAADKMNSDRFSATNPPWFAGSARPISMNSGLRLTGERRDLTEAEYKAAQLEADLQQTYGKLLSVIEDLVSVQADVYAASS